MKQTESFILITEQQERNKSDWTLCPDTNSHAASLTVSTDIAWPRSKRHTQTHTDTHRHTQTHTDTHRHTQTHSLLCLLMLSAAMPPCGAAGYMEGMLVVMKSAICCRAKRLVGVFPFFSWSWIIVSSSSQNACQS